ncbi:MAG: hypothetical protein H6772_03300 [Pseudomonadales bacterium]|nr:hypothetical protein [Pseudomonadales bacterium]
MNRKLFATLSDQNALSQVKISLTSLIQNSALPKGTKIMLLTDSVFPKKEVIWFKKRNIIIKKVKIKKKSDLFPNIYQCVFYLFSDEVKNNWDQVVFVEADTLIIKEIGNLFKVQNFSAVRDILTLEKQFLSLDEIKNNKLSGSTLRKKKVIPKDAEEKIKRIKNNYNVFAPTFNAGIFAFSTKMIPVKSDFKLFLILEKYFEVSRYGMQGILNLYFYQKWQELPRKYNSLVNLKKISFPLFEYLSSSILHFAGSLEEQKPWANKNHSYFKLWNKYAELSNK